MRKKKKPPKRLPRSLAFGLVLLFPAFFAVWSSVGWLCFHLTLLTQFAFYWRQWIGTTCCPFFVLPFFRLNI